MIGKTVKAVGFVAVLVGAVKLLKSRRSTAIDVEDVEDVGSAQTA